MDEADRVRTFVAVDLAPEVHAALARLKAELARVRSEVRWVRDGGLHVTLKFLGAVAVSQLTDVRDAVARVAASVASFTLRVRGLGAFPSLNRPRVLWAGIEANGLTELTQAVERALVPLGFSAEARAFHAHITLGRVGGGRGWAGVERLLKLHWVDDFGVSPVDRVTIYRSDLKPGGAVYTPLWTTALVDSTKGEATWH